MTDASLIRNCETSARGGAVMVNSGAVMNMYGTIENSASGTAEKESVYLEQGSLLNVKDAPSISNGVAMASEAGNSADICMTGNLESVVKVFPLSARHDGEGEQFAVTNNRNYKGCEKFVNGKDESLFGTLKDNKSDNNVYWRLGTANLTVTNTVSGAYADMTREFTYSISLPDNGGKGYAAVKYAADSDEDKSNDKKLGELTLNGDSSFGLKNGEYIVIKDVTLNKEIRLEETGDDIGSADGQDGHYKMTVAYSDEASHESAGLNDGENAETTVRFKLKADTTANITNTLEMIPVSSGITDGANPILFMMLGIVIAAYREFVSRVDVLITRGLSKPERVREIIRSTTGKITKTQIMKQCPDISQKTVERALRELMDNGEIIKIGGGRYTSYTWNWEKE
jgi:hypothetical protein